jgi:hypothetical protein
VRKPVTADSLAGIFGLGLILLGVLGCVPGVVRNCADLTRRKSGSAAELLEDLRTSILHNLIHIGFGVLAWSRREAPRPPRCFLTGGGLVYFGLGIYGPLVDYFSDRNFMPTDRADDWLHVDVGAGMLYAGLAVGLSASRSSTAAAS